jgi:DNA-binding NtrC family response regulator
MSGDSGDYAAAAEDSRRDVLLVAADLEERRLLFAQLKEAGYSVLSVAGVRYAMRALAMHLVAPRLILVDVDDDPQATPETIHGLRALAAGARLMLVVGAMAAESWKPLQTEGVALVRRPITVGKVLEAVKRVLGD